MKRILTALLAAVLLASCGGKDSYKIKGEIQGIEDGAVMVLSALEYDGLNALDSTVVKDGKFTFKGQTDTAQVAVITFEVEGAMRGCQLFLERGNITVLIDVESGNQFLAGAPNNDAFQKFYDDTEVFNDEADEIEDRIRVTKKILFPSGRSSQISSLSSTFLTKGSPALVPCSWRTLM